MNIFRLFAVGVLIIGLCSEITAQTITVAEVKTKAIGSTIANVGLRITVADQFRNTCFAQDGTAGIALFNSTFRNGVKVGDSVLIKTGTITEFQPTTGQPGTGLFQITSPDFTFIVVPVEAKAPEPRNITIPAINESVEGQLVRVRGVEFLDEGAFQGENNYTLKNQAGNTLQVRIDGNTDIAVNQLAIPSGRIDVIGVISQFRGTYQLQPRFAVDLGLEPPVKDTVQRNRTLDVTTWNLYWFGDTTSGPNNSELQLRNVARAMNSMESDIIGVQEIAKENMFNRLRDTLQGGFSGFIAKGIDQAQKTGWLFRKSTVQMLDSGLAVNGGSQAWASGRFPYRLSFRTTIEGKTSDFHAFVIHGKATDTLTAEEDRTRREQDATTFHTYLNSFYGDKNVIVVGDFNDDVIKSTIKDGTFPSPYKIFVDDVQNWSVVTKQLSERGLATYIRTNRSMIDHIIVSNEIAENQYRAYIETPNAFISSYTSTTSDHLPVTARMYVTNSTVSVQENGIDNGTALNIAPNPVHDNLMMEFIHEKAGYYTISLINHLGEKVSELANGFFNEGIDMISVPMNDVNSGTYYVQISNGSLLATEKIQIIR